MKMFIMSVFIVIFQALSAANVQWDVFECTETSSPGRILVSANYQHLDVSFYIGVAYDWRDPMKTLIYALPNEARVGTVASIESYISGAWTAAQPGDIVDRTSTIGNRTYFFNETFGSIRPVFNQNTTVEYESGAHQYFKFVIQDFKEVIEYVHGVTDDIPSLYYGWAEYIVDDGGTLRIVNSAIDMDGGAMIVGGGVIPEPSSGILCFIGLMVLMLQRRYSADKV